MFPNFNRNPPSLSVRLDRSFYEPGQQINGLMTVYLSQYLTQPVYAKIKLTAQEHVRFVKEVVRAVVTDNRNNQDKTITEAREYSQEKTFLDLDIPVAHLQQNMLPGEHTFPFSVVLGSGLPSTFTKSWTTRANGRTYQNDSSIRYSLGLRLEDYSGNLICQEVQRPLSVQNIKQNPTGPEAARRIDKVHHISSCCKDLGKVRLISYFEKDKMYKDEDLMVVCEIDGSQLDAEIESIHAELKEDFEASAEIHTETASSTSKSEIIKLNLGPHSRMTGSNSIRLSVDLRNSKNRFDSSVKSSLITCKHTVTVYLTLKGCCITTPSSSIPLQVFERPPAQPMYEASAGGYDYPSFSQRL